MVEPGDAGDFPGLNEARVGADVGFKHELAVVVVGAPKAAMKHAGQGGFGVAGVRAFVAVAILENELEAMPATAQRHQQHGREAGGHEVGRVVEPSSKLTKQLVARATVAHHRVEGVHRFIGHQARHAGKGVGQQRGHYAIAQVFGQAFEHGGADLLGVEPGRVAPHNSARPSRTSTLDTAWPSRTKPVLARP